LKLSNQSNLLPLPFDLYQEELSASHSNLLDSPLVKRRITFYLVAMAKEGPKMATLGEKAASIVKIIFLLHRTIKKRLFGGTDTNVSYRSELMRPFWNLGRVNI
jgi:hypothetical protein